VKNLVITLLPGPREASPERSAGGSPPRGIREFAGFEDLGRHDSHLGLDIFILKSNDTVAVLCELARSVLVLFSLQIVNASIQLYNKSALGAVEIGDERAQRVLAAELVSAQLPGAQGLA
jgi:hypothetical protein